MFSFLSLIPELKVESGHLYPYHKKVGEAITQMGGDFVAYLNFHSNLILPSPWKKWFRRKKDPHYNLRRLGKLWVDFNRIFRQEKREAKKRILFYESFSTGDLTAFIFSAVLFAKKKDKIWLLFRFLRDKKQMRFQAILLQMAARRLKKRLLLLCDSEMLAPQLEKLFQQKVDLLPHYLSFTDLEVKNTKTLENVSPLILAWPGGARAEKGLSTIQQLLERKDPASPHFLLLLPKNVGKISPNIPVEFREERLAWKEYVEEFERSAVILLPYDPQYYHSRTSAIFIETLLAKKIPLVREGTWLAAQVKKFDLHELIVDWDHPHFFTQLLHLVHNKEMLKKLEKMHLVYREEHSMHSFKEKVACLNV